MVKHVSDKMLVGMRANASRLRQARHARFNWANVAVASWLLS